MFIKMVMSDENKKKASERLKKYHADCKKRNDPVLNKKLNEERKKLKKMIKEPKKQAKTIDEEIFNLMKVSARQDKKMEKKDCNLNNKIKPKNKKKFEEKVSETKSLIKEFNKNIRNGKYLYVVKKNTNKIILINKKNEKLAKMKHHHISNAENVSIAGELLVKNKRFFFDNNSGHYVPEVKCLDKIMRIGVSNYGLEYVAQKTKQFKKTTRKTLEMKVR